MSAPEGTVFTSNSAAIDIKGFAQANSVLNNRIRGRASAGLAILDQKGGTPSGNSFVLNDLAAFKPSVADIFIDQGASDTFVLEPAASVVDHGVGTVIVPVQ